MECKNRFAELELGPEIICSPSDNRVPGIWNIRSAAVEDAKRNTSSWNTWMDILAKCPRKEEAEVVGELATLNKAFEAFKGEVSRE